MGLFNLIFFLIKVAIGLFLAYLILIVLMFGYLMDYARTPEGQKIIDENPYNHMQDGRIDPEWQKKHPIKPEPEPRERTSQDSAPEAPTSEELMHR